MQDNTTNPAYSPKVICGIDTLYYFYETNDLYDDFFIDILDQMEESKGRFEKRDISYANSDIKVSINNQIFEFNGKAQGFYWFTNMDNFVTVGFKDNLTNRGLNDIQVQFTAVGIYTLGLKALLRYVDDIFKEVVTEHKPITRVDLNTFIQTDLSWLTKDMFVSRKRRYATHMKEVSSKYKLQTLYIGREPFLLRLYDKKEELKNSKKNEMMYEYFLNNGFTREGDIFNIEFELHRKYLKTYNIDTVDDLLGHAEKLFKECMDSIRLVDLSTISENSVKSKNRYKADMHPLWQHISDSYELKEFLALDFPLERMKRKSYTYTVEEAIKEQVAILRKAYIHNVIIDEQFYDEAKDMFDKSREPKYIHNAPIKKEIEIVYENISEPVIIKELNDLELDKYIKKLEDDLLKPDLDSHVLIKRLQLAYIEKKSRGRALEQDSLF
ncbi:hypothetical protein [Sulfurimonas sp. HSL-1716]|uniref:hypothetical protein n=1 Tax=Hydrocurvibacter sulfurireducens TaxID=3131937 RepID=UPI0031F8CFAF